MTDSNRLSRITAREIEVFEDETATRHWLQARSRVLGCAPLALLDTGEGAARVEAELGRIERGLGA